ncbi:MAG TPA: non-heme iron oxygenase ferredoxin subunit [Acidimicrobiales bacterium]|nr:non-heme iron oxygenase ferredoxin subunit [Acidimicrobiales bacterium]
MGEEVRLCGVDDLEPNSARRFDVGEHRIALVRVEDEFFALGDQCSHEDYSLSEGEVLAEECEIECWKHGSTFELRTGTPCSLPATKPVPVYMVRVAGDDVLVELP